MDAAEDSQADEPSAGLVDVRPACADTFSSRSASPLLLDSSIALAEAWEDDERRDDTEALEDTDAAEPLTETTFAADTSPMYPVEDMLSFSAGSTLADAAERRDRAEAFDLQERAEEIDAAETLLVSERPPVALEAAAAAARGVARPIG